MPKENIVLLTSDPAVGETLERKVLTPAGYTATFMGEGRVAEQMIKTGSVDLVMLSSQLLDGSGLAFARHLAVNYQHLPLIWLTRKAEPEDIASALRVGFWDVLLLPPDPAETVGMILRCLQRQERMRTWVRDETQNAMRGIKKHLDGMESLQRIGRSITSLQDLEAIITAIVDAAVDLTGADESSLFLLNEQSGELYLRASRNFQDDFVRKTRQPPNDPLALQVLRTGQPLAVNETVPQKVKTAYLLHTLIYVPLQVHGRIIGVLGVDNRPSGHPFQDEHLPLVTSLADYSAIAIENARSYERSKIERTKLETIVANVEDGVLVVDHDDRIIVANRTACAALCLDERVIGRSINEVFLHEDILDLLNMNEDKTAHREVKLDDDRTFNAQRTRIADIGVAITMQDITHLKELDRIKSEFVNNVSHDLRSPLTAILGYIELIDRVGPMTAQQKEFIQRVQISVHNITALINDLLDLGRIEAGFDTRFESVSLVPLIKTASDVLSPIFEEKRQVFSLDVPGDLPVVLGNPTRLRQMFINLLANANKYTPPEGKIILKGRAQGAQVIIQVIDNGQGIPASDQPYIFDKFFRASNIAKDAPGTGLGLSIVRSIVDNHGGRIWVDSVPSKGTSFTVVLPILSDGA